MLTAIAALALVLVEPVPSPGPFVTTEGSSTPGIDTDRVAAAVETAMELPGARFGIAVADFRSGDTVVRGDGGLYGTAGLGFAAAAMHASEAAAGVLPQWAADAEGIGRWLETAGPGSTFLPPAGSEPGTAATVMTTPGDALRMLGTIALGLGSPALREELCLPFAGTALADLEGDSVRAYGILEYSDGGACLAAVAAAADGGMAGVVVLADRLCCPEKADLAFRLVWESL